MVERFHRAYVQLTDFVAEHPEIEIGDSVTSIPEGVRPDFYGLFNQTRQIFVEEEFPAHIARARLLQEKCNKAAEAAAGWLSMEDPPTVSALQRFLRDPMDCLIRELFDPLFDLLKGRESIEGLGKRASARIEALFPKLFRSGYERWAVFSLMKLFEVEKAFRVHVRNLSPGERTKSAAQAPMEEVPFPQESSSFYFSQPQSAIFTVPDFIVRSSRLRRFVGIRSEFRECSYNALNASPERAWHPVTADLLRLLGSGLTLIYLADEPASVSLVADVARFCGPDMVLWCIDTQCFSQKEALNHMMRADARLKPPRGSYLIVDDACAELPESSETNQQVQSVELPANVHILNVGYDEAELMPIVEALSDSPGHPAGT
jgi:hypothetical protein